MAELPSGTDDLITTTMLYADVPEELSNVNGAHGAGTLGLRVRGHVDSARKDLSEVAVHNRGGEEINVGGARDVFDGQIGRKSARFPIKPEIQ